MQQNKIVWIGEKPKWTQSSELGPLTDILSTPSIKPRLLDFMLEHLSDIKNRSEYFPSIVAQILQLSPITIISDGFTKIKGTLDKLQGDKSQEIAPKCIIRLIEWEFSPILQIVKSRKTPSGDIEKIAPREILSDSPSFEIIISKFKVLIPDLDGMRYIGRAEYYYMDGEIQDAYREYKGHKIVEYIGDEFKEVPHIGLVFGGEPPQGYVHRNAINVACPYLDIEGRVANQGDHPNLDINIYDGGQVDNPGICNIDPYVGERMSEDARQSLSLLFAELSPPGTPTPGTPTPHSPPFLSLHHSPNSSSHNIIGDDSRKDPNYSPSFTPTPSSQGITLYPAGGITTVDIGLGENTHANVLALATTKHLITQKVAPMGSYGSQIDLLDILRQGDEQKNFSNSGTLDINIGEANRQIIDNKYMEDNFDIVLENKSKDREKDYMPSINIEMEGEEEEKVNLLPDEGESEFEIQMNQLRMERFREWCWRGEEVKSHKGGGIKEYNIEGNSISYADLVNLLHN